MTGNKLKDITAVTDGIVIHQVNCKGVMGSGVALAIRKKWPEVYKAYMKHFKKAKLGMIQVIEIKKNLYVINLFGQEQYGRNRRYTDYSALQTCLEKVRDWKAKNHPNLKIYIPYKMSCGNAGGNWDIVSKIIEKTLPEAIIIQP